MMLKYIIMTIGLMNVVFASCDECMESCVGYVMNNYGYTQDAAMEWCSTTPDASYGCADTCMDDMGDEIQYCTTSADCGAGSFCNMDAIFPDDPPSQSFCETCDYASVELCYSDGLPCTDTDGGGVQSCVETCFDDSYDSDLASCGFGEEPDACDECLEGCVGYVMNSYGYTQDAAMEWCSTTPDASYGCADTCMDDMGDDDGEDGPPECILDCPEIQPLADFLDNGVGDMTYDDVCEIFISWDGNTCTEDCSFDDIEFLIEVIPACNACLEEGNCEQIFVDECDQCHDECSDEDQECHDACDQSEVCEDDEGCEPCDGGDGCGSYYSEGECLENGCDWLGWEEGPGCDDENNQEDNLYSSYTWDYFTDGSAGGINYPTDCSGSCPDSLTYITSSTGGMITGSGNLYGISSPLQVSIISGININNIALTLSTLGAALDLESVLLYTENGMIAPDSYEILSEEVDDWGGSAIVVEFIWSNLDIMQSGLNESWFIEFSATGAHMSLDQVILVLNTENDSCSDNDDPNFDGILNILDVVYTVGVIVGNTTWTDDCAELNADINDDGLVNVLDIVRMVDLIINTSRVNTNATKVIIDKINNGIQFASDGYVGAIQLEISHNDDFSILSIGNSLLSDYNTQNNTTKMIIVEPMDELLFSSNGEYQIESIIAASNSNYIEVEINNPLDYNLGAAYPNPFNPSTSMTLTLNTESYVSVSVHNLSGQQVASLVNGRLKADSYELTWDAENHPSGIYFVMFNNNSTVEKQKITLIK